MPNYMLLLYAPEVGEAEQAERDTEINVWIERTEEWREAGTLVSRGRLYPAQTATTVRRPADEVELTDGPFAVTKEILVGYYLLDLPDLDEALRQAARLPIARYGSVEVRPVMDNPAAATTPPDGVAQRGA
jgi:hypothetical protein